MVRRPPPAGLARLPVAADAHARQRKVALLRRPHALARRLRSRAGPDARAGRRPHRAFAPDLRRRGSDRPRRRPLRAEADALRRARRPGRGLRIPRGRRPQPPRPAPGTAKADQRALAISAVDIHAGTGSQVRRLAVQAWGSATQSFQIDNTCGGRDAVISSVNAAVGSRRARLENTVRIDGPGADVSLSGISVASGEQEFDQRTLQVHAAGHAKSDLLFKNALLGKARTIFSGLIKVAPDAQRTDAYQTNRNLLLSPDAEADSLPGLEIEANDVKCSHGATTGQIDPAELFYLRARGIPLAVAQELLAQGFLEEVLAKVGHEEAAAAVREMLRLKFHQA
ncbi:MAG: SufD family Fe-S cluster assembly protein [Verrucomicrobia bacterium]|nr:SufD family Fe-S cluster assembly protein [Verrucomicrobiota bacterium]